MGEFPLTRWSSVVQVAARNGSQASDAEAARSADEALQALCQTYWFPIYAFARSRGKTHEDAQDLTQIFFTELIEKQLVRRADRQMTKFRTFLLTHFCYVLSNDHRREQAEKRGGQFEHLSLTSAQADDRLHGLLADAADSSLVYDRAWAVQVVETTLDTLKAEYAQNNPDVPFDALRGYLPGGAAFPRPPYEELVKHHPSVSVGTLKTRVSRLNKRFRELLISVVGDTVSDPTEVQSEIRHLVEVLATT